MKFFHGCTSAKEAKEIYHKLAKCFHPDKGGNADLMKELTDQYEHWDDVVVDQKPFNPFTPNNFRSGYFNSAFGSANKLHELREKEHEIMVLKSSVNKLQSEISRIQSHYVLEKGLWNHQIKESMNTIESTVKENLTLRAEIFRLTRLKGSQTFFQRLKYLFNIGS